MKNAMFNGQYVGKKAFTCLSCSSRFCEKSEEGEFNICQYGVAYLKRNGVMETKEPAVPLSTISRNLRHEINPILQGIVELACELDENLSTRRIDPDNELSLIVGSTIVIDNFIQMITGVHEFHSTPSNAAYKRKNLSSLIDFNFQTYRIIKENGRAKDLILENKVDKNIVIEKCSDFIEYIIAVLIDNAWKYSLDNSTLR